MLVHFNEETCALAPLFLIAGTTVYECIDSILKPVDCDESKVTHLIRPAPQVLFPKDELKFGINEMIFHHEFEVSLTGVSVGKKFNALTP